jgi:predicted flap endonuclease-1-like 5' DNA nuclease
VLERGKEVKAKSGKLQSTESERRKMLSRLPDKVVSADVLKRRLGQGPPKERLLNGETSLGIHVYKSIARWGDKMADYHFFQRL